MSEFYLEEKNFILWEKKTWRISHIYMWEVLCLLPALKDL